MSRRRFASENLRPFQKKSWPEPTFGGETRGLVFGAYGEASADVHDLLSISADRIVERQWQLAGARSASELRSFIVSTLRRRMGMAAVQAMARHRLACVPYIGVPRRFIQAMIDQRAQRGAAAAHGGRPYAPPPWIHDFYQYQMGAHVVAAAV